MREHLVEVRRMKTKRPHIAGLSFVVLLFALVVASAQAWAAKPDGSRVKQTAKPIGALAMDGPRVAYLSGGRIRVWNVVSGATSVVKGRYVSNQEYATGSELAIAGKRVAWINFVYSGNTVLNHWLYTAPLGGSAHLLKRTWGSNSTDCGLGGHQINGLVGSGTLLAVSTWTFNDNGSASWNKRLNLITPTRLRTIATGDKAIISASADAGHIAVVPLGRVSMDPGYCVSVPSTSVSIYIYSARGTLLNKVAVSTTPNSGFPAVALSGKQLVVLKSERGVTLSVYNWETGALLHTWPVAVSWRDGGLGVYGHLASVPGRARLHLVDLKAGKDVIVAPTHAAFPAIGPRGLVYAVNPKRDDRPAKHVFVPMAKLLAMVS
jgi:hypothetical protein